MRYFCLFVLIAAVAGCSSSQPATSSFVPGRAAKESAQTHSNGAPPGSRQPTIYVLTTTGVLFFTPPYTRTGTLPGTANTRLAVTNGNIFLANGPVIQEYVGRTKLGPKLTLPGNVQNLRAAPNGTLLAVVGTSLYAVSKPYTKERVIDTNLDSSSFNLFQMLDDGILLIKVKNELLTSKAPYTSVQVASRNTVGTDSPTRSGIDRSTGILYVRRTAYAFPYDRSQQPVWQAIHQRGIRKCDSPNRGALAAGGNVLIANCVNLITVVYRPPQTTYIASYSRERLSSQTIGSNGVIYAISSNMDGSHSLISYAPAYETPVTITRIPDDADVRELLVQ
jgi:hypothetical protein